MKRQRSRNRGGGNGGKPQHNANRAFDSNGPEGVKVRGAAQHVYEKYQQLARDAASSGDRVLAENYLQHAEHYFRTVRAMQPQRPVAEIIGGRDQFVSFDMDYEEEHAPVDPTAEAAAAEAEGQSENGQDRSDGRFRERDDRQRDDRQRDEYRQRDRDDYRRDDRQRDDRPRDEYRQRDRDDRPREERPRDDYRRDREDRPRDDRPRDEYRQRDDRPRDRDRFRDDRRDRFRDREDRPRDERPRQDRAERDPMAVVEPQGTPLASADEGSRFLRGQDGAASEAPAFLQSRQAPPVAEAGAEEVKKPRRRRAPKSFEADAPAAADADEG